MSLYWILDGIEPIAVNADQWYRWMMPDDDRRMIARDIVGGTTISTVFLGLNHNYMSGPPILFETMTFLVEEDEEGQAHHTWGDCVRARSYEEALTNHEIARQNAAELLLLPR